MTSQLDWLLALNLFSTISMTGIIWFVQIVHYPLMAEVGRAESARYAVINQRLTTFVVGPLMLVEAATTLWLARSDLLPVAVLSPFWGGVGLLLVTWIATALCSVPQHGVLAQGFSAVHHRRLVVTNWIRTLAWTGRALLTLVVAHGALCVQIAVAGTR